MIEDEKRERNKIHCRKYYLKNRELIRAKAKEKYHDSKSEFSEYAKHYQREYRDKNKEKVREYNREYYLKRKRERERKTSL